MDLAGNQFQRNYRVMRIARPVAVMLDEVKRELELDKQRQVTYTELLEYLLNYRRAVGAVRGDPS
jgi:hypothetical protein